MFYITVFVIQELNNETQMLLKEHNVKIFFNNINQGDRGGKGRDPGSHIRKGKRFFLISLLVMKKKRFFTYEKLEKWHISWEMRREFFNFRSLMWEGKFFFSIFHPKCEKKRDFFQFPFQQLKKKRFFIYKKQEK